MRALLINPWIYDFAAYDLWSKPLGLLTIASYLRQLGCELSLIDCLDRRHPVLSAAGYKAARSNKYGSGRYTVEEIDNPPLFKEIPRQFKRYGLPIRLFKGLLDKEPEPDVILVTTGMTYWYPAYIDIIKALRERFASPVLLGGNYANLCPDHARQHSGADVVYKGSDISGILRIVSEAAGSTFDYGLLKNHEDLFPAYELYDSLEYVTLRTSRGCPFRCTYCGWYMLDKEYTRRDPARVVDEIAYFNKTLGVKNFSFYDDALLYEAEAHAVKIVEGIIKRNIAANFLTPNGLHNRFMTETLARLLKEANFVKPRLALETSSPARQAATGAKTTNDEFLRALGYLRKAGYDPSDVGVYILIGLPDQAVSEIEASIRFAADCGARVFLEEYSPVQGTPDYKKTGLPADADPLLHNNSAFPLYDRKRAAEFQALKTLAHDLNASGVDYAMASE